MKSQKGTLPSLEQFQRDYAQLYDRVENGPTAKGNAYLDATRKPATPKQPTTKK